MDTKFMNSENSKAPDPHRLLLDLLDKIDIRSDNYVALPNLSIYYASKNIKNSHNKNEFRISASMWN